MALAGAPAMEMILESAMILVMAPVMVPVMDQKYELATAVTRTPAKLPATGQT